MVLTSTFQHLSEDHCTYNPSLKRVNRPLYLVSWNEGRYKVLRICSLIRLFHSYFKILTAVYFKATLTPTAMLIDLP